MADTVTKKALLEYGKLLISEKVKSDGKKVVEEKLGIKFVEGAYEAEQLVYLNSGEVRKPQHHPRGTPGNMGANPTPEQIERLDAQEEGDEGIGYYLSMDIAETLNKYLGSSLQNGEINYDDDMNLREFCIWGKDMKVEVLITRTSKKTFGDLFEYLDKVPPMYMNSHYDLELTEKFCKEDFDIAKQVLRHYGGYDDLEVMMNCVGEIDDNRPLDSVLTESEIRQEDIWDKEIMEDM